MKAVVGTIIIIIIIIFSNKNGKLYNSLLFIMLITFDILVKMYDKKQS